MKGLAARICKNGIDSICGGIREPETHGYLTRARVCGIFVQFGSIEYTILEQPKALSPTPEKLARENPVQANPTLDAPAQADLVQWNKEGTSNDPSRTDLSNPVFSTHTTRWTGCLGWFRETFCKIERVQRKDTIRCLSAVSFSTLPCYNITKI